MSLQSIVTALAIAIGVVVLGYATLRATRISKIAGPAYRHTWTLLRGLLIAVTAGYILTIIALASPLKAWFVPIAGVTFVLSALFVSLVMGYAHTIVDKVISTTPLRREESRGGIVPTGTFTPAALSAFGLKVDESVNETGKAGRIVIIDDEALNRTILEQYLGNLGHAVETFDDAGQALERLAEGPNVNAILLDLVMPGIDGIEALTRIKGSEKLRDVPVVVVSSVQDTEQVARCIEAGADDFLTKPFNPVLLRARLDACLARGRNREKEKRYMKRLDLERRRSDELLRVILPRAIAEELRASKRVRPRRHDTVSVLFADVVGFTAYCEQHEPEFVLRRLQSLVTAFEDLSVEHGVLKIKTIGDSFMAACGLNYGDENQVSRCVQLGFAMIERARLIVPDWGIRVGIHFGPVVAGVVGKQQFLYDIWGDTVNTAQRIETLGVTGTVCVSATAWAHIKGTYRGESLGPVNAKGKGALEIYKLTPPKQA